MTTTVDPAPLTLAGLRPAHWHRPLLVLAAAMAALAVANTVGALVDSRQVTNVDVWLKPLKFALSTGIYALALAWPIGRLPSGTRWTRVANVAGTVSAIGLGIESAIINGFALVGQSSHFNVSTPFHAAMWGLMAVSIVIVWGMTFVVAVLLFRAPLGDAARSLAIRAGAVVALVGTALAFPMTGPQGSQISDYQGIIGAHTVGLPDGGPGLPLLGWSTVGGDLRIPHFVGMHALQALPLFVLLLEVLALRVRALRDPRRRFSLVVAAVVTYAATLVVIMAQALGGQSIIAPSGAILAAGVVVGVLAVGSAIVNLIAPTSRAGGGPRGAGAPDPVG
ncbi:hypothetical protein [Pseudolysinimonas sp.]|uniref:hypothetical protein n=1 Tax=Pseudolysinimonas sp. TaxID=2680009 RepID=UPI003F7F3E3C